MKVARYGRVSSHRQEKQGTIESQVEALRRHAGQEGFAIVEEFVCLDDGVSGARLDRPGLDRLRDGAEAGYFDAVLVLSPDRLSRKYAYLILILEEFERLGVSILFLEQPPADDPHSSLMVQIQGAVAEYERAKIAERHRRGKLHRARQGEIFWNSVPLGYHRVPRQDNVAAHVVLDEENAALVRKIFHWHVQEKISIRQIARKITLSGVVPPRGGKVWGETTVHRILRSEAYVGTLYDNRTQKVPADRAAGEAVHHILTTPKEDWIAVSIPPIIDRETFDQSQALHEPNRQFSPRRLKEEHWLLRRLLRCGRCGQKHACITDAKSPELTPRYYYRCAKSDDLRGRQRCRPCHLHAGPLDRLVWQEIRRHLLHPELLLRAHKELRDHTPLDQSFLAEQVHSAQRRLRQVEAERRRLVDAYQSGLITAEEFEDRAPKIAERIKSLEVDQKRLEEEQQQSCGAKDLLGRIEEFTSRVTDRLDGMSFAERQALARVVLDEVVLDGHDVHIYFKLPLPKRPADDSNNSVGNLKRKVSRRFSLRSCRSFRWRFHSQRRVPAAPFARCRRGHGSLPPLVGKCGARMRIISFITEPRVVDRILRHRESERCQAKDPFEPRA
ncbi:MAG: recombinase family protein, partial [Acidobacteriota bacterium]